MARLCVHVASEDRLSTSSPASRLRPPAVRMAISCKQCNVTASINTLANNNRKQKTLFLRFFVFSSTSDELLVWPPCRGSPGVCNRRHRRLLRLGVKRRLQKMPWELWYWVTSRITKIVVSPAGVLAGFISTGYIPDIA